MNADTFDIERIVNNTNETIPAKSIKDSFKIYSSKISWTVFILVCFFTLGSWLDISGLWSELPLLCNELPEGPIIFLIGRHFKPQHFTYTKTIYLIFIIGIFSCLLLSLFWNKTVKIQNQDRSVYLYIFNFSLSLLDGMSTVTFLPYIGEFFSKEYIIPNYLGESLSSLIPGVLAMIQGVNTESENCNMVFNKSSNYTINYTINDNQNKPNFSVSVYFLLMLGILIVCMFAFTALNYSKIAINARKSEMNEIILTNLNDDWNTISENESNEPVVQLIEAKKEINTLLFITFLGSFINYGYLPGLLSYSTLPYSNRVFHLSINLSSISLPFAILASIWSYRVSVFRIAVEFLIAIAFSVYIVIISILSPCPPFNNWIGGSLITISWILCGCIFLRVRCLTAARLEEFGHSTLLNYGFITILGQILGGFLIFLLVNILSLFKDKPKCAPINFCS